jgi:hypothetical protein
MYFLGKVFLDRNLGEVFLFDPSHKGSRTIMNRLTNPVLRPIVNIFPTWIHVIPCASFSKPWKSNSIITYKKATPWRKVSNIGSLQFCLFVKRKSNLANSQISGPSSFLPAKWQWKITICRPIWGPLIHRTFLVEALRPSNE